MRLSTASAFDGTRPGQDWPDCPREGHRQHRTKEDRRDHQQAVPRVEDRSRSSERQGACRHEEHGSRDDGAAPALSSRQRGTSALLQRLDWIHASRLAGGEQRRDHTRQDPAGERRDEEGGARREVLHMLRDAVDLLNGCADRNRDAARHQKPDGEAAQRADGSQDRALPQEEPPDLRARGPERSEDPDLRSPLGHGNRERIVDEEHADEQREYARQGRHRGVRREHRVELPAPARRLFNLETRPEQRQQFVLRSRDRLPGPNSDIDAVEPAAALEDLLRGIDIHHRQVAAERCGHAARLHDAADGESAVAEGGPKRHRAADAQVILPGEFICQDDRVGLRQENQRVVHDLRIAALEVVITQAAVAQHVDAEHVQTPLTRHSAVDHGLDNRDRDSH
jgi:hypothetical protein